MPPEPLVNPADVDFGRVVADLDAIRQFNPQRDEMEQLTAVVLMDTERHLVVGYKDVRPDEFWTRGHLPGHPLMPGVLMCEAAAQLCSWYVLSQKLMPGDFIGFAGLENVRFRVMVRPGDRLVLVARAVKLHRKLMVFNVQGFVKSTMVFQGDIQGMPMDRTGGW